MIEKCVKDSLIYLSKRGDLAILTSSAFQICDQISRQAQTELTEIIVDIKIVSLVNSSGTRTSANSLNKDKIENPGLVQQEHASWFSAFDRTTVLCLFSLSDLKLSQHDSLLARQSLPPMIDPSAVLSFALCAIARSPLASVTLSQRLLLCIF
jgi:hypothetical protein